MFTYIRPVKYNVQMINVRKSPAKGFGLIIIKPLKKTSLYHSGHHTTIQPPHKPQPVKHHSNITTNLESSELKRSYGYK